MERTSLRTSVVALLGAILLSLALAGGAEARAKAVPKPFFGINATVPTDDDFKRMGKVGFGAYRFDINWAGVQKTRKGSFDWTGPDATVTHAVSNGMQPLPLLIGTPRFVSQREGLTPPTRKADLGAWEHFAFAAAQRYGKDGGFWQENPGLPETPIRNWVIWNEQNARAFWHPKASPRDYARLVQVSHRGITAGDPKARVVLGGMFGYPKDERSMSAVSFLRKLYSVPQIESKFDAIGVHPYGSGVSTVKTQIKEALRAARRAGDRGAKILVGELGWASNGPKEAEENVGEKGQAARLKKGLKLLVNKRRSWNVLGAFVYVWRDFPAAFTPCLWCPYAGLVEENGSSKAALRAVRGVIRSSR
jgi:hypothetical protein